MLERRRYHPLHISRLQLKQWSSILAIVFALLSFFFISGGIWLLENNRIESEIIGRRYYYEGGILFIIIGILLLFSLVCQSFMIHLLFVSKKPWRFTEIKVKKAVALYLVLLFIATIPHVYCLYHLKTIRTKVSMFIIFLFITNHVPFIVSYSVKYMVLLQSFRYLF
ncbi:hypothetical protein KSF78_0006290 [Schistosoma japonicum]|nr:hypothetical protein KSF78_0006290 [Schistosoma japonicum]KAH8871618.1 hypothetical protein KSF78_0006290 [Schistosoma japonicum]